MKKRRFADGGETTEYTKKSDSEDIPSGGRFDSDTYARARAWQKKQMEGGGDTPAPKSRPAPKPALKPSARPVVAVAKEEAPTPKPMPPKASTAGSDQGTPPGQIPVGSEKAPPKDDRFRPGETGRNILNTLSAIAPGAGRVASAAARAAPAVRTGAVPVKEGIGAAVKYGPRAGVDVAKSTARGAQGRADIRALRDARNAEADAAAVRGAKSRAEVQAKRAAREADTSPAKQAQRASVDRMAKNSKDRMVANKARREDMEGVEFSKGGAVRGAGKATRGCGKGSMR